MSTSAGIILLLLGLGPRCLSLETCRGCHSTELPLPGLPPASGTMSEARRDSTSSLQRKKPPWLKLDIPAVAPPAAEDPSFLQVGSGLQGLWEFPGQAPHQDFVI